ncbi:hydrolase [Salmonella phage vB_SnwM_CGG4-1]|uniref:Uncharacterized protein n=1 Tax=Salmonella phage vB_SnwM_CGG4-1 TaxID=1815631 RepID=A0A1B0VV39_9CAUD|nr:hydrolase [Salmonella phage vB_SnwM_CGG4-1]ANA49430.1 hypothetical protein CGG41_076 [Salmonella phage vB_SnwM_CGG4-1]
MKLINPNELAKQLVSVQPIDDNIIKDLIETIGDGELIISSKLTQTSSDDYEPCGQCKHKGAK